MGRRYRFASSPWRWSRTIRGIDPVGHLGSALVHSLAFALLAVMLSGAAAWAWALPVVALLARLALKWQTDHALRLPFRDLWLLPLWDIASFSIFVTSFFGATVHGRGADFRVSADGTLLEGQDLRGSS